MKLLFENFETLIEAPNGIKKLRELILQLAVQGKLVPQDPKDEPASALFEKIQVEKENLVKDGLVNKQQPLKIKNIEEYKRRVPTGWVQCKLGNIIFLNYGKAVEKSKIGGKIPAYGANGILKYVQEPYVLQKSIIVGRKGSAGALNIIEKPFWPTDVTYYVLEMENLNFRYLYYLLLSLNLTSLSFGIKPGLNRNNAYELSISLPPLAEQKRIVEKVDSLMALCDDLEKQQEKKAEKKALLNKSSLNALSTSATKYDFNKNWNHIEKNFDLLYSTPENIDDLKQTILQLAVMGKLVPQDPKDEPIEELLGKIKQQRLSLRLNEKEKKIILDAFERLEKGIKAISINPIMITARCICDFITKGTTPAKNELLLTGDIPYLKVYNIVNNIINFVYKPTYISRVIHNTKLKRSKVLAGDVLMNIVGPPLGKVAIVPNDFDEWNINQALAVFRPIESIDNKYLYYVLSCHSTLKTVLAETKGTAGQDNLSLEQCRNLQIPIYTLNEQKRIVAKVDSLMALCDDLKTNLVSKNNISVNLLNAVVSHL